VLIEDNTFFEIEKGAIYSKSLFDFEAKSSYIRRIPKILKWVKLKPLKFLLLMIICLQFYFVKIENRENLAVGSLSSDFFYC
jgi:1-acyl-sn-glycerol-3-phosphate acyltransferase